MKLTYLVLLGEVFDSYYYVVHKQSVLGAFCLVLCCWCFLLRYHCPVFILLHLVHALFLKIFYETANLRSGLTSKRINVLKLDLGDVSLVKRNVELSLKF